MEETTVVIAKTAIRKIPTARVRSSVPTEHERCCRIGPAFQQGGEVQTQSSQALPCKPSIPSLSMIGTMMSAATGSAHHRLKYVLGKRPRSRIADRYVHTGRCTRKQRSRKPWCIHWKQQRIRGGFGNRGLTRISQLNNENVTPRTLNSNCCRFICPWAMLYGHWLRSR